jgi:hypothetical protein
MRTLTDETVKEYAGSGVRSIAATPATATARRSAAAHSARCALSENAPP